MYVKHKQLSSTFFYFSYKEIRENQEHYNSQMQKTI